MNHAGIDLSRWIWPGSCVVTLIALSVSDIAYRKVSNAMSMSALALGLSLWMVRGGAQGIWHSGLAALAVGGALLPGYVLGWMGAADVKAGAAVGAMVSWASLPSFAAALLVSTLVTSVASLLLVERLSPGEVALRLSAPEGSLQRARARNTTLPFALCLSIGAVWAAQGGSLWQQ